MDLGLTDAESWGLSPRLLFQLLGRHAELERARQTREDYRSGTLAALYANAHRDTKAKPEPFRWDDFFPQHRPPVKPQTDEELLQAMELWAKASARSTAT